MDRDERKGRGSRPISPLEWIAALTGLALTAALAALTGLEALRGPGSAPPQVVVVAEAASAFAGGYVVQFRAVNGSSRTAANVQVVGTLRTSDGQVVESRAMLDFVPGRSETRGGLFLPVDPRDGSLELRASGYAEP